VMVSKILTHPSSGQLLVKPNGSALCVLSPEERAQIDHRVKWSIRIPVGIDSRMSTVPFFDGSSLIRVVDVKSETEFFVDPRNL